MPPIGSKFEPTRTTADVVFFHGRSCIDPCANYVKFVPNEQTGHAHIVRFTPISGTDLGFGAPAFENEVFDRRSAFQQSLAYRSVRETRVIE